MEDKNTNVRVITAESDSCVLDTCCCCIPLRTGCLIFGYIELVVHIVVALFAELGFKDGIALLKSKNLQPEQENKVKNSVVISALSLILVVIFLPFTIFLLVGLHKEKRNYVKIYLVVAAIMLLLNVLWQRDRFSDEYASGKEVASEYISNLLSIYFLLVLRSHYIKMGISTQNVPTQYYRDGLHADEIREADAESVLRSAFTLHL